MNIIEQKKIELQCFNDPLLFAEKILKVKLFPKQAEIVKKFYDGGHNELVVVAGMRCLRPGEIIQTFNKRGKSLEKIKIGDTVRGFDFKNKRTVKAKVIDKRESIWRNQVRLHFEDGTHLDCSPTHKFPILENGMVVDYPANTLQIDDNLAVYNPRTRPTVRYKRIINYEVLKGPTRMIDITLDKTPYFLLKNGTITHNSGKTMMGSVIAAYEAFRLVVMDNPQKFFGLPNDTQIFIVNIATSQTQAKDTVFAQLTARIKNSWWFQDKIDSGLLTGRHNEYIFPQHSVIMRSEHSNSASIAGKNTILCVLDELARFKDTKGQSSAKIVYETITRSTKTFGKYGKIVSISSPIAVNDYFYGELYESNFLKKRIKGIIGFQAATWEMNPNITQADLASEFEKDPETAWRDYGAIPSKTEEPFYKSHPEMIMFCEDSELVNPFIEDFSSPMGYKIRDEFVPEPMTRYYLAGDPAMRNDSFGLAMGHKNKDGIIIADVVHRFKPKDGEIDVKEVTNIIMGLAERFPIDIAVFDTWWYMETLQRLKERGIEVKHKIVSFKEHSMLKEKIYGGKIKWFPHEKLATELSYLGLYRGRKVDHPKGKGYSKDVADAVANLVSIIPIEIQRTVPVYAMVNHYG